MRWLMLTLYSPLAAFGEARAGRARQSWTRPGRSAVLGMVAAALGVDRDDLGTHAAISSGLGYAVRTDATGHSLTDWHTVRIGDGAPAKRARTRAEELAVGATPLVTRREYRMDALHTVALWERDSGQYRLEDVAEALRRPRWVLYLGRKSCPLALPVNAEIVEADTLRAAFALRPALPPQLAAHLPIRLDERAHIASDDDAAGIDTLQTETRFDLRDGRQWRHRVEHIMEA